MDSSLDGRGFDGSPDSSFPDVVLHPFAIVHIYLVFYHDYIEQRGETSSIIGGWKFIEEDIADKEEVTETAETITKIAKKG